ncbi:MAG TPA: CotH kinase family protein, partial [Ilumatobacteraceae bacterium]|nr:CotH kinase family protein [Ilumatobacteraceae bacterium]
RIRIADESLLRNPLVFGMGKDFGLPAPGTRYCEVFLNTDGGAITSADYAGVYRVRRHTERTPLVSVVIPTDGHRARVWGTTRTLAVEAIRSIATSGTYQHLEFVVLADPDTPPEAIAMLRRVDDRVRVIESTAGGVHASIGDLVLLLADDTELIAPDSIAVMVALLSDAPNPADAAYGAVGAVGAKLLAEDGTICNAGYVVAGQPVAVCAGWPGDHPGPQRVLAIARECSAVSVAALMTTRALLDEVIDLPAATPTSIQLCSAIRAAGRRILYTPDASWYQFGLAARPPNEHNTTPTDPYYNPNLTPGRGDWLELPNRSGAPPRYD